MCLRRAFRQRLRRHMLEQLMKDRNLAASTCGALRWCGHRTVSRQQRLQEFIDPLLSTPFDQQPAETEAAA